MTDTSKLVVNNMTGSEFTHHQRELILGDSNTGLKLVSYDGSHGKMISGSTFELDDPSLSDNQEETKEEKND